VSRGGGEPTLNGWLLIPPLPWSTRASWKRASGPRPERGLVTADRTHDPQDLPPAESGKLGAARPIAAEVATASRVQRLNRLLINVLGQRGAFHWPGFGGSRHKTVKPCVVAATSRRGTDVVALHIADTRARHPPRAHQFDLHPLLHDEEKGNRLGPGDLPAHQSRATAAARSWG